MRWLGLLTDTDAGRQIPAGIGSVSLPTPNKKAGKCRHFLFTLSVGNASPTENNAGIVDNLSVNLVFLVLILVVGVYLRKCLPLPFMFHVLTLYVRCHPNRHLS